MEKFCWSLIVGEHLTEEKKKKEKKVSDDFEILM